jgi:hypothetical protein
MYEDKHGRIDKEKDVKFIGLCTDRFTSYCCRRFILFFYKK